jgi:hypothetical protein
MKRYLLILMLTVLPVSAQWRRFGSDPIHPSGFAGVGFTSPVNPAASRLDTGWNVAAGVGVTNNYFGVMLDGMYNDLGVTHTALNRQGARGGSEKYFAITVNPIFHVNERGPVDFYVTAGGGIYSQITRYRAFAGAFGPSGREFDLISTNQIYKPGVNAGAGFAFRIGDFSNMKIFAEARYHRMFVGHSDVSLLPVTVGIRF